LPGESRLDRLDRAGWKLGPAGASWIVGGSGSLLQAASQPRGKRIAITQRYYLVRGNPGTPQLLHAACRTGFRIFEGLLHIGIFGANWQNDKMPTGLLSSLGQSTAAVKSNGIRRVDSGQTGKLRLALGSDRGMQHTAATKTPAHV
jgi:hypothetical protein